MSSALTEDEKKIAMEGAALIAKYTIDAERSLFCEEVQ